MSEERQKYKTICVKHASGTWQKSNDKSTRIELFKAKQWRRLYRPHKRNTYPRPPSRFADADVYWETRFRVRVNGKWWRPGSCKYYFMTIAGVMALVEDLI